MTESDRMFVLKCKICGMVSEPFKVKDSLVVKYALEELVRYPCGCGGGLREPCLIDVGCLFVCDESAV